ncbi:discoidin domain-containing protein [Bacteroides thetaiotaomicron]|nr:discoidin domain-containing protein [Bacteroides thetaiotaomicron]
MEKIKRLRNHACIAVWCGDNEGYPLQPLNKWLEEDVRTYDGGDRAYHANSHSDGLSGSGPWTNSHPNWYFTKAPYGYGANITKGWGFRTEIGTAVFTTFDSFKKFMPEKDWWPRNEMWDKHFFGNSAGNASPDKYFSTVEFNYGKAKGIEDFCRKAQLVNVEVNKAMYEGFQHHIWEDASGILTWMGQSAYPSLVWQTYDYYYDLTGAYWGIRKACEPVHIQWSYADNSVKVINTTLKEQKGLTATGKVYNLDGKEMGRYSQSVVLDAAANKDSYCFHLNFTTDNLAFGKKAVASSISADAGEPSAAIDASDGSRWASEPRDEEWIYVDLGEPTEIASVILNWEAAHAKAYKLLISDDAINWKEIYINEDSKGGVEEIKIKPVRTRYVKMQGLKQATMWGYSLYEFELYGRKKEANGFDSCAFHQVGTER